MSKPRIYVACLAAYNAGKLHGKWIDATLGQEHIEDQIKSILATSPEENAEEYAIHDYEGFATYKINEYQSIETVAELAEAIEEHGELIVDLMGHLGLDSVSEAIEYYNDNYAGEHSSLEDFAAEFLEDTGELNQIPVHLRSYFDFESFSRDLELGGDVFRIDNHVFWNR